MTKEEFAALLNGREYNDEMTSAEEAQAKAGGLIVLFGASDDLLEARGAVHDESGACGGSEIRLHAGGFLSDWESLDKDDEADVEKYFADKPRAKVILTEWDKDGYSWVISTKLPHATFDILEDGEKYCRGIVIDADGVAGKPT